MYKIRYKLITIYLQFEKYTYIWENILIVFNNNNSYVFIRN